MTKRKIKPSEILEASKVKSKNFNISELAYEFVEAFGGTKNLAKEWISEYQQAKQGSVVRLKLFQWAMQIIIKATESDKPKTDVGEMSDEELQEALIAALRRRQVLIEEEDDDSLPSDK